MKIVDARFPQEQYDLFDDLEDERRTRMRRLKSDHTRTAQAKRSTKARREAAAAATTKEAKGS